MAAASDDEPFDQFRGTDTYIASEDLRHSVNCAVALGAAAARPGRARHRQDPPRRDHRGRARMPLIRWNVKSTTSAQDGLYVYDTVQRLYDSRFGGHDGRDVSDIRRYIKLGPLGRALKAPKRVVLLIDEVDKADIEFPNDLLHELDRDALPHHRDRRRDRRRRAAGRDHHQQQREGAAGRLPPPLRLPLHRLPRPRASCAEIVRVHHPDLTGALRRPDPRASSSRSARTPASARAPRRASSSTGSAVAQAGRRRPRSSSTRQLPFLGALLKKEQDMAALADQLAGGRKCRS